MFIKQPDQADGVGSYRETIFTKIQKGTGIDREGGV
jgi:hypothetical protein